MAWIILDEKNNLQFRRGVSGPIPWTGVLPPSEMGLCQAAGHYECSGETSPCPLQKPAETGFVAGAEGANRAGIRPKAVGTGCITEGSSDSWTARNSHSYIFHVLSKWSDTKLVKGVSLSKVRPVVTVCSQLTASAGPFPAAGQALPVPGVRPSQRAAVPSALLESSSSCPPGWLHSSSFFLPGKGGFARWWLDEGNVSLAGFRKLSVFSLWGWRAPQNNISGG